MFSRFRELAASYVDGEIVPLADWDSDDLEDLAELIRDELGMRHQQDLDEYTSDDDQ